MRVLIVKTSSMGDVLHTLPALTDATRAIPSISFDWVVEPSFAEIPKWHPAVDEIIVAPIRQWRKQVWTTLKQGEVKHFLHTLRQRHYDYVIDAQGLLKSALITRFTKGTRKGLDFSSAREKLSSLFYQQTYSVPKKQHAVERIRQLFAQALGYSVPASPVDYGIDKQRLISEYTIEGRYLVFLHGTTWATKHWPESYWSELTCLAAKEGYRVLLPWGSENEKQRANRIQQAVVEKGIACEPHVLPRLTLNGMTQIIAHASGIVAVDTGLGHIAAAMAIPTVSLYGSTDPTLTGAYGPSQVHLHSDFACSPCLARVCQLKKPHLVQPPCFTSLSPQHVWSTLKRHMNETHHATVLA